MTRSQQLPDQLFFKIGEVAEIVGVKPHVLRYWESEFRQLRPMKTRGSHRIYKRRDVEVAVLIRRLLHDEGYTIPGARKRLRELRFSANDGAEATGAESPTPTLVDVSAPMAPLTAKAELRAVSSPKTEPGMTAPSAGASATGNMRAMSSSGTQPAASEQAPRASVMSENVTAPRPALPDTAMAAKREANLRAEFLALRNELTQALKDFDRLARNEAVTPKNVRVQQVVLSPVSVHR